MLGVSASVYQSGKTSASLLQEAKFVLICASQRQRSQTPTRTITTDTIPHTSTMANTRAGKIAAKDASWGFGFGLPPAELRRDGNGNIMKPPAPPMPRDKSAPTREELAWIEYFHRAQEAQNIARHHKYKAAFEREMKKLASAPPVFAQAPGKACNHVKSRRGCPACLKSDCERKREEAAAMVREQSAEAERLRELVEGYGHRLSNAMQRQYEKDLPVAEANIAEWEPRLAHWEKKLAAAEAALQTVQPEAAVDTSFWDRSVAQMQFALYEAQWTSSGPATFAEDELEEDTPIDFTRPAISFGVGYETETDEMMRAAKASSEPPLDDTTVIAQLDHVLNCPQGFQILSRLGLEPGQALGPRSAPANMAVGAVNNAKLELSTPRNVRRANGEGRDLAMPAETIDGLPDISSLDLGAGHPSASRTEFSMRAELDQSYSEQTANLSIDEQKEMLKTYKGGIAMLMDYYVANSTSMSGMKRRTNVAAASTDSSSTVAEQSNASEVVASSSHDNSSDLALDEIRPGRDTLTGFTNWLSGLLDAHQRACPENNEETFRKRALGAWHKERTDRLNIIGKMFETYAASRKSPGFKDAEPLFADERSISDYTGFSEPPVIPGDNENETGEEIEVEEKK
ncbi:hypothetical protein TI39_contig5851g00009 [Zymoseptoria brevis]|uniref:Uncharacterized protein n=1 Tax=Zymoseptoria brevis TaxID=1047168 RepID=A0A0F4G550_9PEZI|nr:hypothetical protein TI39_contig5851g00009 [Zymoseptoria brevis]